MGTTNDLATSGGITIGAVLRAIAEGDLDGSLDQLASTLNARRKLLHEAKRLQNVASLVPGSEVRITKGIRPQSLVGLVGTVERIDTRFIDVRVHPRCAHLVPSRYRRADGTVGVPASCLERL